MASTKVQLEEMNKPNPRYILELHTVREMIQEADNMDKGLRTVLSLGMYAFTKVLHKISRLHLPSDFQLIFYFLRLHEPWIIKLHRDC
jgi:hypothetical protein